MEMKKVAAELVAAFESVSPGGPEARPKKMFGYPCAFVHGNMFMGLMGDHFILRLSAEDKPDLETAGGSPVEGPQGHVMKEYLALPSSVVAHRKALAGWVAKGYGYAAPLPPSSQSRGNARSGRLVAQPHQLPNELWAIH